MSDKSDPNKQVFVTVQIKGQQYEINALYKWKLQSIVKSLLRNKYFQQGVKSQNVYAYINNIRKSLQKTIAQLIQETGKQELFIRLTDRQSQLQMRRQASSLMLQEDVQQQKIQPQIKAEQIIYNLSSSSPIKSYEKFESKLYRTYNKYQEESDLSTSYTLGQFLNNIRSSQSQNQSVNQMFEKLKKCPQQINKIIEQYQQITQIYNKSKQLLSKFGNYEEKDDSIFKGLKRILNQFLYIRSLDDQKIKIKQECLRELQSQNQTLKKKVEELDQMITGYKQKNNLILTQSQDAKKQQYLDSLSAQLKKSLFYKTITMGQQQNIYSEQQMLRSIRNKNKKFKHLQVLFSLKNQQLNLITMKNMFENLKKQKNLILILDIHNTHNFMTKYAIFTQEGISNLGLNTDSTYSNNNICIYNMQTEKLYQHPSQKFIRLGYLSIHLLSQILSLQTTKQSKLIVRFNHRKVQDDYQGFWDGMKSQQYKLKSIQMYKMGFNQQT